MDERSQGLTNLDRAIAEALDVTPSPEFVARVRQRIGSEPRPSAAWFGWRLMLGAAAVAAIVLAVALAWPSRRASAPATARTGRDVPLVARAPEIAAPTIAPAPIRPAAPVRPRAVAAVRTGAVNSEPEVLVPRAEIDMYRRLIARASGMQGPGVIVEPTIISAEAAPEPIVIEPIRIDPIMPPPSGEGERQ